MEKQNGKIGLIDVDNWYNLNQCFPNLPLMKLSAHYKNKGDLVEWYDDRKNYDIVFLSKVFSFTPDFTEKIHADKIIKSGSGYAINLNGGGHEVFNQNNHVNLHHEIEHLYPDYSLYNITDTAYGFMSRGCPRNCFFCHVGAKEGCKAYKVADLNEFWNGQRNIKLLDPNTLACSEWKNILAQLIKSNAWVDFTQGVDIRLMSDEKCDMLMLMKLKHIHFAWDRYEDKDMIIPKFEKFKSITDFSRSKVSVYILTNYNTTIEQDLERIMFIRSLDFQPYVMRYNKQNIKRGSKINALARWCNNKRIFWKCPSFEQYLSDFNNGLWR